MSKKIPQKIKKIIHETRTELEKIYAGDLKDLMLYGSYSRGEFTGESDIDLALIINKFTNYSAERNKYLPIISRISLKYDTVISVTPFDYKTFNNIKTPLILNISREGIKV